jgi:hypothetical protein
MRSPHGRLLMNPDNVNDRLDQARTSEEIVAAVRDFLGELKAEEVDRLPRASRPTEIGDPAAIERWAQQLSKHRAGPSQDPINRELIERVRDYFAHAARRLAKLPQG